MHYHIQVCLDNATKIDIISRVIIIIDDSIAFPRIRPTIENFVPTQFVVDGPTAGTGFAGVGLVYDHHLGVCVIDGLVQQSPAELVWEKVSIMRAV